MCGISGMIRFDGRAPSLRMIKAMNDALRHRGPDGEGVWAKGPVALAHRRLAIIDIAGGAQPMVRNHVTLTFNGEIYNYRELRTQLEAGFDFTSDSDTEVVIAAYLRWGTECLTHLRGMFALALYDDALGRLFIARDRLGIKPLYYTADSRRLTFSSELTPLLLDPELPRIIDLANLAAFFHHQYVPTPGTIYRDVFKLDQGHFLLVDRSGTVTRQRYWKLEIAPVTRSPEREREELYAVLDESIRLHLRSDAPFGAFLSGGVDSSLITGLMSEQLHRPVESFTAGFAEKDFSELPYAAEAARVLGTNHHESMVDAEISHKILPRIVRLFGEPFGDSSAIPTFVVSELASNHVKMVLSGDGGDELFGGYPLYGIVFKQATMPMGGLIRRLCRWGAPAVPWPQRNALIQRARTPAMTYHDYRNLFQEADIHLLMAHTNTPSFPAPPLNGAIDPVTMAQYMDVNTYMLDDILTKVDRMSMANGLEARVPLLDHKVAEFAFSLPLSSRVARVHGSVTTKVALKRATLRYFSESFLSRKKMGFGVPLQDWLRGPLRSLLEETRNDWESDAWDFVRFRYARWLIDNFLAGNAQAYPPSHIWQVLMYKMWFDHVHLGVTPLREEADSVSL